MYIYMHMHVSLKECVGIQAVTLWISYRHPMRNKYAGFSFEFSFMITLTVIYIYRTVTNPKN